MHAAVQRDFASERVHDIGEDELGTGAQVQRCNRFAGVRDQDRLDPGFTVRPPRLVGAGGHVVGGAADDPVGVLVDIDHVGFSEAEA